MHTEADFLAKIIAEPDEDTPRLVFADWLEEHGQPERAEFIRIGVRLATLGKPHIVVTEPCVLERTYGPGYYTLTGGEETRGRGMLIMEANVGDRVDIPLPRSMGKDLAKPKYGLRVVKITDDEIILANDDKSAQWAGEELWQRGRELLVNFPAAPYWRIPDGLRDTHPHRDVRDGGYGIRCHGKDVREVVFNARRGLFEFVVAEWGDWRTHADTILAAHPVREVTLTTVPTQQQLEMWLIATDRLPNSTRVWVIGVENAIAEVWPCIKKWNLPPVSQEQFLRAE